jgi:N-acetylglucosaminyldiphosphoundecaprenol N-acetyl-beta-D-mannosaminyltransferase
MGGRITPVTVGAWLEHVAGAVRSSSQRVFVSQNMHSLYLLRHDERLQATQRDAHIVRVDGLPIVWVARAAGMPLRAEQRAGFMDLMHPLMARAASDGWRVWVIAGRPGVAARAAELLRLRHEGLVLGVYDGYFDIAPGSTEVDARAARARAFAPDIIIVGLGMPRQEHFLLQHRASLPDVPLLTCGAAFDYVAGVAAACPRWLSAIGLEWLFRLVHEPKRLAFRYVVEPLNLVPLMLRDIWNVRRRARG